MLMRMHSRKMRGFTLIELMVVVVVIAILSAIALPSYQNSVRKGRRQVAISDMLAYKQAMERYRNNRMSYAPSISGTCDPTDPNPPLTCDIPVTISSNTTLDYTFSIDNVSTTNYRIIATAQARQNKGFEASTCPTLYLTGDDARTPADCWAK